LDYRNEGLPGTLELMEEEKVEIIREGESEPAGSQDRVEVLEKKVRDLEALVKGLMEELLDLKSVAMKLSKANEERSRTELKSSRPQAGSSTGGSSTLVSPRKVEPQSSSRTPEPVEKVRMIMQPDGTLKEEKGRGEEYIIASASYGKNRKNNADSRNSGGKQGNSLIIAEDEEKQANS
jgi:hypothetical protein